MILIAGCPEPYEKPDRFINLVNKSNDTVVYFSDYIDNNCVDTVFYNGKPIIRENSIIEYTINPGDSIIREYYFDVLTNHFKNEKLLFYFIDKKVVDTSTWKEISDKYMVLKRVTIKSVEELDYMNWTIVYL